MASKSGAEPTDLLREGSVGRPASWIWVLAVPFLCMGGGLVTTLVFPPHRVVAIKRDAALKKAMGYLKTAHAELNRSVENNGGLYPTERQVQQFKYGNRSPSHDVDAYLFYSGLEANKKLYGQVVANVKDRSKTWVLRTPLEHSPGDWAVCFADGECRIVATKEWLTLEKLPQKPSP